LTRILFWRWSPASTRLLILSVYFGLASVNLKRGSETMASSSTTCVTQQASFGESCQDGAVGSGWSEYNSLPTTKNAVAHFGVCLIKLLLVFLPAGVARLLQIFKIPSRDRNHVDIPSILGLIHWTSHDWTLHLVFFKSSRYRAAIGIMSTSPASLV